jgi:drug/metabolite transporter (DMT)-like permease
LSSKISNVQNRLLLSRINTPMDYTHSLPAFLSRYFPVFIGAFFLAVFSMSCMVSLVVTTFIRGHTEAANYMLVSALALSLVLCFGNFMMIRGRTWAVWIIVALLIISLLAVLPTYPYRPHMFSFTTGILFPLLGLLMLNSKRHREMRSALVKVRAERIEARRQSRQQR